jgi:hypothetical protein
MIGTWSMRLGCRRGSGRGVAQGVGGGLRIELEQTGLSQTDGVTHLEYRVVR